MIKYVYPLEKILLALLSTTTFIQLDSSLSTPFWSIVIAVSFGSLAFEGAKPYSPMFVLITVSSVMELRLVQCLLVVVTMVLMAWIRFYHIEIYNKGQYEVGYRKTEVNNIETAVFYPTTQKGKNSTWITSEKYYQSIYDIIFIHPCRRIPFPFKIFKFFISFLGKIKVPAKTNANLYTEPSELTHRKKVILFSHGLASFMNNFSSICAWWASHGYIVISVNHVNDKFNIQVDQDLLSNHLQLEKFFFEHKNPDLLIRAKQYESVYDALIKKNMINIIFSQKNNRIKIEEIHFAGHSLGGATIIETMANLRMKKKVSPLVKGLICLDPWHFPLSSTTYENLKDENMLFLNSQTFIRKLPFICYMEQKLNRLKSTNAQTLKAFVARKTDHLALSDYTFTAGTIVKHTGIISLQEHTKSVISFHQKVITLFMEGKSTNEILEESNQYAKQIGAFDVGVSLEEEWRVQTDPTYLDL